MLEVILKRFDEPDDVTHFRRGTFETVTLETPTWVNELGAKGVGESGTIGSIPSVYNAVIDAVAHLGIRHLQMPITPAKLWHALND